MKIYHNPRCRKSRETLALIEEKGVKPEIIMYMTGEELSQKELKDILKKLGMKASEIVRKGEKIYKEDYKGKSITEAKWLKILIANPKLIERPIVLKGSKAILGRPPENVLKLL